MTSANKVNPNSPRAVALSILVRAGHDHLYSNLVLDTAIRRHPMSDADRGLLTALVYGVLEKELTLDYLAARLSVRPLDGLDDEVRVLLRLGLYQLRFLDRVPAHAAVSETVELAPPRARGFVNAVLREYTRRGEEIAFPDRTREPVACLSVTYSFPEELVARFVGIFGLERTERLLASAECPPALTVRVNTLRTTPEKLAAAFRNAGAEVLPTLHAKTALRLAGGNPTRLPGFEDGDFFVQDEASQLCVEAVDARPGMTVLDVCACPGSKSFGMAIEMKNEGKLLSSDLHDNKLSLIERGAERLGIKVIETVARDGRDFDPALEGIADRVLCDVPCSGFGVFAKKPELRYKPLSAVAPLPDIQLAILETAARYVRPDGVLVYSTCTLLPEENGGNVARFLARHPEFSPEDFTAGDLSSADGMLTLLPDEHGTDGFFIAKMKKR